MGSICSHSLVFVEPPLTNPPIRESLKPSIKEEPCEKCSRCGGFPGYGVQCKYWAEKELQEKVNTSGMNEANRRIFHIMNEKGSEAAVKEMFTGEQGQELSYAEMRSRYG